MRNGIDFENKEVKMLAALVNEKFKAMEKNIEEKFAHVGTKIDFLHELLQAHISERKKWRATTWAAIFSFILTVILYILRYIIERGGK